ncbi:MAG: transposase [Chloroflexi bacterium]|nr:transposase [Chloroflexota bacterium]
MTLGVDTHAELHVAAALDERGRLLGTCSIPTTTSGYAELLRWTGQYGDLVQVGIDGTGSYGAGLARWLRARQVTVIEVDRPDRRTRRRRGKSDSVDAEAAARAVLAGVATARPKAGTGAMEMVRALRVARQSAIRHEHRPPMNCTLWLSPLRTRYVHGCDGSRYPSSSRLRLPSVRVEN